MSPEVEVLPAGEEHLPAIAALAAIIWRQHYPGIVTAAQIEYMLARMYAIETLREEIRSQGVRYDRLLVGHELVGFAGYGPTAQPDAIKLHKLYLLPSHHGRGFGSRLLKHVEDAVRKLGQRRLILSVNKRNTKAITAYLRNGYVIVELVTVDIGGGFVMDDYVMAKELA